jgi:hypothetical protein
MTLLGGRWRVDGKELERRSSRIYELLDDGHGSAENTIKCLGN